MKKKKNNNKTAMHAAITWQEDYEYWHKVPFICDCKSLVDAVDNRLAPDEGIRLV